jgi:hypothetical protein
MRRLEQTALTRKRQRDYGGLRITRITVTLYSADYDYAITRDYGARLRCAITADYADYGRLRADYGDTLLNPDYGDTLLNPQLSADYGDYAGLRITGITDYGDTLLTDYGITGLR